MRGVLERGIPDDFGSFFKRARFFRFRAVTVDGERTNLYDYENDVIRPLGEPRVHFALNCMVRDCPRLPRVPFSGDKLETQLEAAAVEFFNSEKYVRVDDPEKVVRVSAILDFYTEDFTPDGRAQNLITYLNHFRREAVSSDYKLRFLDYDWTINQQP